MLLSDIDIRAEIGAGRLIFDPPVAEHTIGVSVDLTLHDHFWRSTMPSGEGIETSVTPSADPYLYCTEEVTQSLVLEPGGFVLGETAEGMIFRTTCVG